MCRYWFLQRLSIYFGLALCGIYAAIIGWKTANPLDGIPLGNNLQLVLIIVGLRFVAFIFEELVDVSIDGMLHNDLVELN